MRHRLEDKFDRWQEVLSDCPVKEPCMLGHECRNTDMYRNCGLFQRVILLNPDIEKDIDKQYSEKLQPHCTAVHEPTGIHYCSQIRDIRVTPVCAYQSVVPCRELGINRCMYSLEGDSK